MAFAARGCQGSTGLLALRCVMQMNDGAGVPDAHAQSCTSCRHNERCPTLSTARLRLADSGCLLACLPAGLRPPEEVVVLLAVV